MIEPTLKIEVYSDVVCPWCYVGKRRLERALDRLKDRLTTQVVWKPFQLNPTMPSAGMDRRAYLEAKFGSLDSFRQLEEQVQAAGASTGITFAFDKIARAPNTFAAHRLIWFAGRNGCQNAVVDSLFRGYFEEGADIGMIPVLAQLAGRAGLPDAERFLQSDAGVPEVNAEAAAGHAQNIRSVPYFLIGGARAISGAQPVETFVQVLTGAAADRPERKAGV
ncbi:MAG: DsbA family oxidoreductase [Nitrospira sp.]|nr:MAG: DsbA family oxidoreductase [Nitrospira sp.]